MIRVSIITRTKDRIIMLKRAAESVANQRFRDFEWIVVNDGGDPVQVDDVLDGYRGRIDNIKTVHHAASRGMEAASNAGIAAASQGVFLVIHDDDDSWDPDFLKETVSFLSGPDGATFGGVISQTLEVDEIVKGESIIEKARRRWHPMLGYYPEGGVHISDLSVINQFPPIAFLYRRAVLDRIGCYNEKLPVLGDWEFNLRFIMESDIAVIPKPLANYHHRRAAVGTYGNSVHAGSARHLGYEAIIRNGAIRKAASEPFIAQLLLTGRQHLETKKYVAPVAKLSNVVCKLLKPFARMVNPLRNWFGV
jgi:glycosyltransferase involved in cell wall biosynthesis